MALERFTQDHEYIRVDGDVGTIGITNHAQEQLGDVVFVELPDVGRTVNQKDAMAVVESVKAASEIYAPVSGEVVEVNAAVTENPSLVNEESEGDAWFFKLRIADKSELDGLMDRAAYEEFVKQS